MTELVERSAALAALDGFVERAARGEAPLCIVTGLPGTGRSLLARRTAERAVDRGVRVLRARALPPAAGREPGAAADLVADLVDDLPGAGPAGSGVAHPSDAVLHDRCRVVLAAAASRPVLVVVDDLLRAGPRSRAWLQMLLRRRHSAPIAGLVVLDGAQDPSGWDVHPAGPGDLLVRTAPLTLGGVRAVLAAAGVAPDRRTTVLARRATGGNPAVLDAALARLGSRAGNAEALCRAAADARREQVGSVLDGLPGDLSAPLLALAVCGGELEPVSARLGGPGPGTAGRVRNRLRATGLVTGARLVPDGRVVVEAVLARVGAPERRALFREAIELAVRCGLPDDAVARIARSAPTLQHPPLGELLLGVARRRRAAGRAAEAVGLVERALGEPVPPRTRTDLTQELARARERTDPATAARLLARCAVVPVLPGGPVDLDPVVVDTLLCRGEVRAVRNVVAVVRRSAAPGGDRPAVLVPARMADELGYDLTPALGEEAPASGATAVPDGVAAWSLTLRAQARDRAVALARAALAATGGDAVAVTPRVLAAATLAAAGHRSEALDATAHLLLGLTRRGRVPAAVWAVSSLMQLSAGRRDAARRDLDSAWSSPEADGTPLVAAAAVLLHLADDSPDAALAVLARPAEPDIDRPGSALLRYAAGLARHRCGDPSGALAEYLACGRLLLDRGRVNPVLAPWRSGAARVLAARGDHDGADRLLTDELRLARRWGTPAPVATACRHTDRAPVPHPAGTPRSDA